MDDPTEPKGPLEAFQDFTIAFIRSNIHPVPDDQLARILAIYHEEWERRHGETWIVAP